MTTARWSGRTVYRQPNRILTIVKIAMPAMNANNELTGASVKAGTDFNSIGLVVCAGKTFRRQNSPRYLEAARRHPFLSLICDEKLSTSW